MVAAYRMPALVAELALPGLRRHIVIFDTITTPGAGEPAARGERATRTRGCRATISLNLSIRRAS